MKIDKLRLVGFKSFVEPTDFEIRPGLTGIVGPNGCGKSNLLESLRWVMGATSAKALRSSGMEDMIFSGTSQRPARQWAEVTMTVQNDRKDLPVEFNDLDLLEISRRIVKKEEGSQSIYKVNGKEARARDIQLLFADASTGANSPALVRQGQISELINAKPANRRKLLEEAAGITGLYTRRHEAELRLRAAETNLERLDDVTGELETQRATLARQARQATRYRNLSGDIRRTEAMSNYLRWAEATEALAAAEAAMAEINGLTEETARVAATASAAQLKTHEAVEPLRMKEAEASAALHRLNVAMEGLDAELARAKAEANRLQSERDQIERDITREKELSGDADQALEQLEAEEGQLRERQEAEAGRVEAAATARDTAAAELSDAESDYERKNADAAEQEAERRALTQSLDEARRRYERLTGQIARMEEERAGLKLSDTEEQALAEARRLVTESDEKVTSCETRAQRAAEARSMAREREEALRGPKSQANRNLVELQAEADAIRRVIAAGEDDGFEALLESVSVASGYENALAAALGDDLNAALDEEAASHWSKAGAEPLSSAPLPPEAEALAALVTAPPALTRRLKAIGVIDAADAPEAVAKLQPGQRLVSRAGDLWRWDGFVQRAEAKTAAAIRLEHRNRLEVLNADIDEAEERLIAISGDHDIAAAAVREADSAVSSTEQSLKDARRIARDALSSLTTMEKKYEQASARLSALTESLERLSEDKSEAETSVREGEDALSRLPDLSALRDAVATARELLAERRNAASETRAAYNDLARDAEIRARRLEEISRERGVWASRAETAGGRIGDLETRLTETIAAQEAAQGAPEAVEEKRKSLFTELEAAESRRRNAADAFAEAQSAAGTADRTLKEAEAEAVNAREERARREAKLEAARERVGSATELARENCEAEPEKLLEIAEHKDGTDLPSREEIDRKLERYKRERENLGGVNLRADVEMEEIDQRLKDMTVEREDCEQAIRKLRSAIGNLNKEGRQRLLDAFNTVNEHFQTLFVRLFGGGSAELRLVDSDDPLEAGLEIFASPPGKKLSSMSLMSGGEQALTATALIFAVFMSNPAPVCVLDEVDAPLDDANVDRFCAMLDQMAKDTETKFIIITHHALTMSRMDRLYGVTMIERGVSQLVSVDLNRAEEMVAAE
ncbi:chromosome segregation protein SMC [Parvularcula flava]|uniref:Chromosome partition protein Smc n=1 Tax=Aquisalinus luteolus TaxID=1566827 RepID=A0A8J3A3F5_9PROT|nr:chromosome segregation protein SMC [Aquisalinus luteolus]NHK28726.1 chromosome segregation protein SMC [Aquisalinus luteolus]GGH99335.1 chromosome partition protein Smc [Aquisalinus luteolus]